MNKLLSFLRNSIYDFLKVLFLNSLTLSNFLRKSIICKETGAYCNKNFFIRTLIPDNSMWGLDHHLKDFINPYTYIEHGVFFGDGIVEAQYSDKVKIIVTMSPFREEIVSERLKKKCLVIGNYLNYISPRINLPSKNTFKDSVIFFGAHSTNTIYASDNYEEIIQGLRSFFPDKTIYISLFYLDYLNENLRDRIEYLGAKSFCLGNRYDHFFLDRLKLILSSADIVVTNDIGSHIGYSLACGNIPYWMNIEETKIIISSSARHERELGIYRNTNLLDEHKTSVIKSLPLMSSYPLSKLSQDDEENLRFFFGHDLKL